MSKVDFQRKKKDEEEQKIVGQQQKTQSTASKPVGTTSIPKDNQGISSRTQKSAASSSRTEERRETSNQNLIKKNTYTANSAENRRNQPTKTTNSSTENRRTTYADFNNKKQTHDGSGGTWGYNPTVDAARSRYALSLKNGIPGPESLPTIDEFKRSQMSDADRIKDIAKNVDIGQFKTKEAPVYRNGVRWNWEPEETPVIKGSDIKENITPEIEQQMLSSDYKLDNDARKIAREYAQQELAKYTSGPGGVPQLNSEEDRQRYAELRNLANKTSPLASFSEGFLDPFEKVGALARDILPKSEEAKANNALIDQYRSQAKANASAQNPLLTGVGQFAGNVAEYALTEPIVNSIAATVGVNSAVGKLLMNQAANAGQDALLSWAPTFNELSKRDDLTKQQKAIEMLKTVGLDLGGNAIGGEIGLARDLRKSVPNATEQIIKNAANQTEQAASNIDNIVKQMPEAPVNSVTDIPYQNVDEVIQPNINNALGGGNPFSASKDEAIKRLTALGGDTGNMAGPYHDLLNAADKESIDDFTRAYQAYQDAAKANNMNGFSRPLQRLNDAVNGYMPENVSPELLNSTNSNIDAIEDGLNRISRLEGLSDLGKKHLDSSYELLNQYDDAIRNGGNVQKIAEDLSRTLGNLDNQAKKLDGYDGVFSAWKGGGTARGDLYSNTGNIPKEMNLDTTPEEKAMFDEWNARDAETMHAKPANQLTENSFDNVNTSRYDENRNSVGSIGGNGNGTEISTGYDGTGSEGILSEDSTAGLLGSRTTANGVSGGQYLPADRVSVSNQLSKYSPVFDKADEKALNDAKIAFNDYKDIQEPELFSKALETAKANNPHGGAVDSHSAEQVQEILDNGGKTFLTSDGTAGGAVDNGNLTAVFKDNKNNETPNAATTIAIAGIKNGAYKGDCFGIFLANSYSKAGFEPVARMNYGYGFNEVMDRQVKEQLAQGLISKEPDVYALKLIDGYDYKKAIENYKTAKKWKQAELDNLPLFEDYDEMLKYRDSLISGAPKKGAFSNGNNSGIPGAESLPKASTDIPSMDDASRKTFDRGPEGRIVDTDDIKERGYARSTRNNPDIPDEVAADFVDNPEIYNVLHNKDTKAKAQAILDKGFDDAYADYKDLLNKKDPAAVPLGYDLAKQMIENGDSRGAADLIRDMSKSLTESGQFSQAAAITLMRNDPMTALRYAEKELDSLNKEGAKKFKDWTDFKLTDDEIKAFNALDPGDKEGITKLFDQIGTRLGKEYPTTAMEKLLEARRVGMLFNVRTNVRNFGANVPTLGMRWASDRVDAVGQNIAHIINPDFKVTQSLTGSGKQGRKLATEVFNSEKVQNLLKNTDGKYADSVKGALVKEKQMYKGTAVDRWIDKMTGGGLQKLNEKAFGKKGVQSIPETIRNATYKALELGDSPFVKENFIERLGSYIKAQGYKSIDEIPEEAIETAWESAMKATYKDQSWAYKMIRDIKAGIGQAGKPGKVVSESLIPFVQAPGNIAARMVDYSPVGAANGVKNIIKGAKSGSEKAVREGINQLAQGTTGSLALGIGIALHNSGLITGGYSQDKDKKSHEKNNGFREYALHVGDHYYTIDWAQPAFQTIMTGVLLADAINKSDAYDSDLLNYFGVKGSTAGKVIGASKEAAKTTINAWFNASPLQSMQDLLGGTYEDSSDIASKLWSVAAENFAGSYVPASVNAVAKTMDTTQRQTYDPSSKTASFVNSQIAKIPGLSEKLPAKYNTWGEEIKTADTTGEAAFNRFLNPGESTKENKKPIDTELDRLFDATGNNAVYPQVAPNTVNNEKLTAKQVSELQKNMGEKSLEAANKFMDSDVYKEMTDDQKAEGYNDLYTTIKWAAQLEMSDPETYKKMQEGDEEALKTIGGNGATMKKKYITEGIDAVIDDIAFGQKKTEIDTTGNGSVTQDELLNYINNGHQDEADKLWDKFKGNSNSTLTKDENGVYTLVNSKGSVIYGTDSLSDEDKAIKADLEGMGFTKSGTQDKYKQAQNVIPGITTQEFGDTYKAIDTDNSESINQDEVLSYLNGNKVTSQSEADKIWAAYGNNWKSIPNLVNGEWAAKSSKSKSTSSTNNGIKPTGNNNLDTKLKAKQKVREDYQKNKIPTAEDLPTDNSNTASSSSFITHYGKDNANTYDLHTSKGYAKAKSAGISDSDYINSWRAADTNGNEKITKGEATAYINALNGLSQDDKRLWFDILISTKAKNPY